jgi:hypothetical protein
MLFLFSAYFTTHYFLFALCVAGVLAIPVFVCCVYQCSCPRGVVCRLFRSSEEAAEARRYMDLRRRDPRRRESIVRRRRQENRDRVSGKFSVSLQYLTGLVYPDTKFIIWFFLLPDKIHSAILLKAFYHFQNMS